MNLSTVSYGPLAEGFLELNSVIAIMKTKISGTIQIETYSSNALYTDSISVDELSVLVDVSKSNQYSSSDCMLDKKTEFKTIKVGDFSFKLDIFESKTNTCDYIIMDCTFNVKDDRLKMIIESINGVESYNEFNYNKYQTRINIGKLFNPYFVRNDIETKLQEFLTD